MLTSTRRVAALPLALLVMVIMTLALATAFMMSGTERRVNDSTLAQSEAFTNAESGLQRFLTGRTALGFTASPPAVIESTTVAFAHGHADVVMQQLRPELNDSTPAIYVVRSRGVSTRARLTGLPRSERTVAQMVYWSSNPMKVSAGWTSLTGLRKNGGSGTLGGADGCGQRPAVAGVGVPTTPGYQQNGGSSVPSGTPPILDMGTPQQAADAVGIDWNGIVNNNTVQADVTIPPGSWPSFSNPDYWPVILIRGDAVLPSGRGTVIVTGDLTISGSTSWEGVLLVGNNVRSNGNNNINGAVISGLNVKLGMTVPEGDVGNGNKTFRYNSCNVASAMSRFAVINSMSNTWMDNWPGY